MFSLDQIERVYCELKTNPFDNTFSPEIENDLKGVMDYFNLSREETIFIIIIFCLQLIEEQIDLKEIRRTLKINEFQLVKHRKHLDNLVAKGIIEKRYRNSHMRRNGRFELRLVAHLYESILGEKPFPSNPFQVLNSEVEWLEAVNDFLDNDLDFLDIDDISDEYDRLCQRYEKCEFQAFMRKNQLSIQHTLILIYVTWQNYLGDNYITLDDLVGRLYETRVKRMAELRIIKEENHPLFKKDFLEGKPGRFAESVEVRISEKLRKELKKFGIKIEQRQKRDTTSLQHDKIVEKQLYFTDKLHEKISKLEDILKEENYQKVKNRMQEKGMQAGITALFFGAPGTGKTECVLQFAKKFKRNVIHVDISETKSMWFGQSEKLIKRIFSQYKEQLLDSEQAPILLLNEADAILGKRKQNGQSGTDNTENAMQNILLEELEKFEGILIATTNLAVNLDSAFDRRFLFKVKFETPTAEQRLKIWQIKLPNYDPQALEQAANDFELSGGQIQNVVRKLEIDYILSGTYPDSNSFLSLCHDELALQKKTRGVIGF